MTQQEPAVQPADASRTEIRKTAKTGAPHEIGELRLQELQRSEGPRREVLDDIERRTRAQDEELSKAEIGEHFLSNDPSHAAAAFDTSIALARAVFAYTGRARLTEDEFRSALDAVRVREV